MLLHQRIAAVIAREGFSELWPRVRRRLIREAVTDDTNVRQHSLTTIAALSVFFKRHRGRTWFETFSDLLAMHLLVVSFRSEQ